jgi:hypothetical protein
MESSEGAGDDDGDGNGEVKVELVVSKNKGLHLKASNMEEARVDEGNILEARSKLLGLDIEFTF